MIQPKTTEVKILHLFCGSGLGALGFQLARGEHRGITGVFRCIGGIDNDPLCCEDFTYLTGAPAHCVDLFDRRQYIEFNGHEPPAEWHEITGEDLRRLFPEPPDVIFLSPPCKGFSGLLSERNSKSVKYQALNRLLIRAMKLVMDAWGADAPAFILIENVPRIKTRGAAVITEVKALLGMYGYLFHEQFHECGEIGGLGQRRKRFLLVARNPKKAPSFLYQPPKQRLKSIGEVIGALPEPGDTARGGPLHRLPNLQWKTWVRLAIIPAGGDWRDLNKKCYSNVYRVVPYDQPASTVTGGERPNGGAMSVADPRIRYNGRAGTFRLVKWEEPAPAVTGNTGTGRSNSISGVADPRVKFNHCFKITPFDKPAGAVASGTGPSSGATAVADPRVPEWDGKHSNKYQVEDFGKPSNTVIAATDIQSGALSVADPWPAEWRGDWKRGAEGRISEWDKPADTVIGHAQLRGSGAVSVADPRYTGHPRADVLGVMPYDEPAKTVIGAGDVHAGACAVADPRIPSETESGTWVIIAEDGTWHRPLTTLELAALQGMPMLWHGAPLRLAGNSEATWREHIGNGVPVQTAKAMGDMVLATLLPNIMGDWHWDLDDNAVWVKGYRDSVPMQAVQ